MTYSLAFYICIIIWVIANPCLSIASPVNSGLAHSSTSTGVEVLRGFEYTLHTSAFSDYAFKKRSIEFPEGKFPKLLGDEIEYPIGTEITKSFYFYPSVDGACDRSSGVLEAKMLDQRKVSNNIESRVCLLETRVLRKEVNGWKPEVYLWSEDQMQATRLRIGVAVPIKLNSVDGPPLKFNYKIPNEGECRQCHEGALRSASGLVPIGPSLVRRIDIARTQFPGRIKRDVLEYKSTDLKLNQTHRSGGPVRNYMDINCGHCHNPNGTAAASTLFLDYVESRDINLGLCKPAVAVGMDGLTYDVLPGRPDQSILFKRFTSLQGDLKMPELAKAVVDPLGKSLIQNWIASINNKCEF